MTDASLMEADCIHGNIWYECDQCEFVGGEEDITQTEGMWADEFTDRGE